MGVMAIRPRPAICERARAWASLRLDAELSEFEEALLNAHLRRCSACCEYEESVRGAVLALRDEPLARLEHPVSVPSRRRAVLRPAALARAAAIVAVAVGIATVLTSQSGQRLPATPASRVTPTDNSDLIQGRALRVAQLGAQPTSATQMGVHGAVLQLSRL
jgi:ferric-dicitrate binding protein FerR (iron transport regulator)